MAKTIYFCIKEKKRHHMVYAINSNIPYSIYVCSGPGLEKNRLRTFCRRHYKMKLDKDPGYIFCRRHYKIKFDIDPGCIF